MTALAKNTQTPASANRQDVSRLHSDIDRLFGGFLANPFFDRPFWGDMVEREGTMLPQIDMTSDDKAYTVSVELPGVEPEAVKIELSGNTVTLSGEKKEEVCDSARKHVQERRYGSFMRSFTLPEDADAERITAVSRNGVLTLAIPRREESKPRSIEVQKA